MRTGIKATLVIIERRIAGARSAVSTDTTTTGTGHSAIAARSLQYRQPRWKYCAMPVAMYQAPPAKENQPETFNTVPPAFTRPAVQFIDMTVIKAPETVSGFQQIVSAAKKSAQY